MMRSGVGFFYKIGITFFFIVGIGVLFFANVLAGLIMILIAFALFGAQGRREKRWHEDQRHREMIEAMRDR